VVNGIILKKFEIMEEVLAELRSLGQVTAVDLQRDWRTKKAIERNLQILVEIVIDVCQRIIALSKQTPASSGKAAIERCVKLGVLSSEDTYAKMVQFRNVVVHRYENIDPVILADIVRLRLGDFEQFRDEVLQHGEAEP